MKNILIALLILICCVSVVSASVVSFDGRHITICDSKGKPAAQLTYSGINDITSVGGYIYVAKGNMIKIINIKNPKYPMGVNGFKPGANHIIASNKFLYTANDRTFRVYDLADPTKPREIYKSICVKRITSIQPHGKIVVINMQGGFIDTVRL